MSSKGGWATKGELINQLAPGDAQGRGEVDQRLVNRHAMGDCDGTVAAATGPKGGGHR